MMEKQPQKVKRVRKSPQKFDEAVKEVIERGLSNRSVAAAYQIGKSYLARLVKKARDLPAGKFSHKPNIGNKRVFNIAEEESLVTYLKTASRMAYGLTYVQARQLACQYAKELKKAYPTTWDEKQEAGLDWQRGFMQRHRDLSLRQPGSTSLAKTTSFNHSL